MSSFEGSHGIKSILVDISVSCHDFLTIHIQNLKVAGLKLEEETTKNVSNKLKDLIFVISGKFLNFSRDEIQNKIKLNGGKISKSLSSKTDFLISGENMGPKKKIKAKEIGTKIISEDDFISMI